MRWRGERGAYVVVREHSEEKFLSDTREAKAIEELGNKRVRRREEERKTRWEGDKE